MKQQNLCEGPLFGGIVRYSIPIILTSLLQLLFNAADLVVVGRFCGSVSVAAVGATGSLTALIVNLFIGLSVGAGVTTAHAIGAKKDQEVRRTVHTAMPLAFLCGLVLTVVGVLFSRTFLQWMATPEDVIDLSAVYMKLYFCGMVPSLVYNFGAAILRAAGNTKGPLIYLSLAGVMNVVLNVIFVTLFHMNVAGVALATAISQVLSAVLVVRALCRQQDACRLRFRRLRFDKTALQKILQIGLPAGIQSSLFAISNVLIQSSINSFGSATVSGNAAAANIEGFVYVAMNAFHQTALNYCGQNMGAGNYRRVQQTVRLCLACVTVVGLVLGVGAFLLGRPLLSIYITDSPEALAAGVRRMLFLCLPYFLCGIMDVMSGVLRGMGYSIAPAVVAVVGVCGLRVVWIETVFRAVGTLESLFISYLVSWVVTFAVLYGIYVWRSRQLLRKTVKE